jgi:hypothetical protein
MEQAVEPLIPLTDGGHSPYMVFDELICSGGCVMWQAVIGQTKQTNIK